MQTKNIINIIFTKHFSQLITDVGEILTINAGDVENTFLTQVVIPAVYKNGSYTWNMELSSNSGLMIKILKELNITLPPNLNLDNISHAAIEAVESGNTEGLKNFIERLKSVNKEREFSAESCLEFLKNTDLPITPKGNILGYKYLNYPIRGKKDGIYVDCHSGKVEQKVGSIVQMDSKYVDPDKSKSCSYGLHVASREYLNSFNGDVIAIVLVQPEDIIAVPEEDTSKIRVCKYQLINVFAKDSDSGQAIVNDEMTPEYISNLVSEADSCKAVETVTLHKQSQKFTVTALENKIKEKKNKTIKTKKIRHISLKGSSKDTNDVKKVKQDLLREDCLNYIREYNQTWKISDKGITTLELYRKSKKKSYRALFGDLINTVLLAEIRNRR